MTDQRQPSTIVHLVGGCVSGSAAAIATCPLEVVKTRLQASTDVRHSKLSRHASLATGIPSVSSVHGETWKPPCGIVGFTRFIVSTEGPRALFKGLGPTMAGIAPTKAIYFAAYSRGKKFYGDIFGPNNSTGHFCAAASAGSIVATATSPIWVLKTRIQLDQRRGVEMPNLFERIVHMYRREGLRAFYRGLSASYFGVSETAIYFVLYEKFKMMARDADVHMGPAQIVCVSAVAKLLACIPCYPHEVARTRMRQAASHTGQRRYTRFLPTLATVLREEGARGLYGGLGPHLMRVIPNTAILFASYEFVVRVMSEWSD
ncbi:solute carrier family 25 member 36-A-like isoform X2 [Sycon ciliatum]|uniref:solute carrier family 25 member 36-A-like isoform X2 n=1 Tax=Sycon ciliatum TaxID=27933 RepID=UPI0020A9A659|eukprot:scpid54609/ scgid5813/ Solute carrier family 25 member 36-A